MVFEYILPYKLLKLILFTLKKREEVVHEKMLTTTKTVELFE